LKNFTRIKNQLIISDIKDSDFRILIYLIARSKDGKCFPSIRTMAKELPTSKDTIKKSIDRLIEKGIIQKENRIIGSGKKTSNLYTINEKYLIDDSKEKLYKNQKEIKLVDYNWLEED